MLGTDEVLLGAGEIVGVRVAVDEPMTVAVGVDAGNGVSGCSLPVGPESTAVVGSLRFVSIGCKTGGDLVAG
jgi:hypothetical protein